MSIFMTRSCKKCGSVAFRIEQKKFKNGSEHLARYCLECNAFIDYARNEVPSSFYLMPFGKHQGKPLSHIVESDPAYARWVCRSFPGKIISKRMQEAIDEQRQDNS